MAHGTRGRWVRVAATGFGVLIGTGLIGCMHTDKDKKEKTATKTPTPGLPGTPMISANGTASRTAAPNQFGSGGIQQAAGTGQPRVGSTGLNTLNTSVPPQTFGGPNANTFAPATISAPANPGLVPSVQPAGGTAPISHNNPPASPSPLAPSSTVASASPVLPSNGAVEPLPPPPPGLPTSTAGNFAVAPPVSTLGPIEPPIPSAPPPGSTVGAPGLR